MFYQRFQQPSCTGAPVEAKRPRDSASEPGSPLQVDDDSDHLVVDASPQPLREYC